MRSQCNSVGDQAPLVRTRQVEEEIDSLKSDDVFVLVNNQSVYIWQGKVMMREGAAGGGG